MSVHCYVGGGEAHAKGLAALHPAWTVTATTLAAPTVLNRACKAAVADIVVLIGALARVTAPLDGLLARLDDHDILLLARQPDDAGDFERDLHIARTGTFSLDFLAVRTTGEGTRFADWWDDRVSTYPEVVDDAAYLAQRWCDLVPGLFDRVAIARRAPPGLALPFDRTAA